MALYCIALLVLSMHVGCSSGQVCPSSAGGVESLVEHDNAGAMMQVRVESDQKQDETGGCYAKETGLQDNGYNWFYHPNGQTFYLDRHHVRCEKGYGLSDFTFNAQSTEIQVKWACCPFNGGVQDQVIRKVTSRGTGDKVSLSGLTGASPVDCGPRGFISWWHVTNQADVEYECATANEGQSLSCTNSVTGWQLQEGVNYLDRHLLMCKSGVIQKWRAIGKGECVSFGCKNYLRFEYTCCEVVPQTTITATTTFSCYNAQSALNDNGRSEHHQYGEVYFLDRHHVRCNNGKGLSSFTFNVQAHKVQVKWSCCTFNGAVGSNVIKKITSRSEGDKYSLSGFLAASPVDCGPDGFISWWHVTDRADVEYTCQSITIKEGEALSCTNEMTNLQEQRGVDYLSRHELQCTPGTVMQKWKATGQRNYMKFEYTCCEVVAAGTKITTTTHGQEPQVPVYGEWCGPGHPKRETGLPNIHPIDDLDACCEQHDRTFTTLLGLNQSHDQLCQHMSEADHDLSACAKNVGCKFHNLRQYAHCKGVKFLIEKLFGLSKQAFVVGNYRCWFR